MIRVLSFLFILSFGAVGFAGDALFDIDQCAEPDPAVDIIDGGATATSTMNVADDITIFDLNASVDITHPWASDLTTDLESPAGTIVNLRDGSGSSESEFGINVEYDDEADGTFGNPRQPVGSLSDFDDESTTGDWTLSIVDDTLGGSFAGDGTINDWCLQIQDCDLVAPADFTCVVVLVEEAPFDIELSWTNDALNYDSIDVSRNGVLLSSELGDATSYTDVAPGNGVYTYTLDVVGEGGSCTFSVSCDIEAGYAACQTDGVEILDAFTTPYEEILNVTDVIFIGDTETLIDATLSFEDEWTIDQTSPAGTTVTLHNLGASTGAGDELNLTYSDDGVANGDDAYDCGCLQQAAGPGTMGDYSDTFANGDWTLTLESASSSFADGTIDAWCLAFVAQCPVAAPTGIDCEAIADDIVVSWVNEQEYDSVTIVCNGEEIATIDGGETSYADQNVPGGVYYYSVIGTVDADGCGRESEECFASRGFVEFCAGPLDLVEGDNSQTLSVSAGLIPDPITSIALSLDAEDANIGDLFIEVTSAAGTTITLFDDAADTGTAIDLLYVDSGAFPMAPYDCACPTRPFSGSVDDYLLDAFLNGFWQLSVSNAVGDAGDIVNEWCLLLGESVPQRGFKRGDVDGNNSVVALIDGLALLDYGFNGGAEPPCNDAADVNGNNTVEFIVDTLDLLMWQYSGGDEPAAPGPFFCGLDDDVEFDADCDTELCSP